jgi:hypothetical protein
MKKIIIALAVAAMAIAAQADIVNGDFSGQAVTNSGTGQGVSLYASLNQGWLTNGVSATTQIMTIDGGVAQRATTAANSYCGIGQLFTFAGTGAGTLEFAATVTEDATINLDFWVELYGYNQLGASTALLNGDYLALSGMPGSSNAPSGSANYSVTTLGTYFHVDAGALSGTQTVNVAFSDDYEFYAIRIIANRPNAADSVTFDNVNIVTGGVQYALTVNANPGGSVTGGGNYSSNANPQITATASNGFAFVNWTGAVTSANSTTNVLMTTNKTVWANFQAVSTYTLTVNANPGGSVTGGGNYSSNANPQITATASNGFAFVNWTGAVTSANSTTNVLMTTDKTVWANFQVVSNIVNGDFSSAAAGGLTASKFSTPVGFLNNGWYTNAAAGQYLEIGGGVASRPSSTPSALVGIGQLFTLTGTGALTLEYDVTVVDDNANLDFWVQLYGYDQLGAATGFNVAHEFAISGSPGSSNAPVSGANYAVTTLVEDWHINSGAISGTQSISFTGSSDYTFYAIRIIANHPDAADSVTFDNVNIAADGVQYTLTVNANPGGSVTGGGNYSSNANPQITATASNGFVFVNWTGAVTSANSTTNVLMTTDKTVWANFQAAAGDTDGDGIPDTWEQQYYGGATNANASAIAANGINTVLESYVADLNPTNANSTLKIAVNPLNPGKVVSWLNASGRVYAVYWTTNLLNSFAPLQTNYTGGAVTDSLHNAAGKCFYKLDVRLAP